MLFITPLYPRTHSEGIATIFHLCSTTDGSEGIGPYYSSSFLIIFIIIKFVTAIIKIAVINNTTTPMVTVIVTIDASPYWLTI